MGKMAAQSGAAKLKDVFSFLEEHGLQKPSRIIQVGASVGQELPLFSTHGVSHLIAIEALEKPFDLLRKNCLDFPQIAILPVNCCVTPKNNQSVRMHVASNFGQSSSVLKPTRHLDVYPHVNFEKPKETIGFSLDTIVSRAKTFAEPINLNFDLLFMDVQGFELEVLKGSGSVLSEISTVYTEVTFGTDYSGCAKYTDIIRFLDARDFKLCALEIDPRGVNHGNAIFHKVLL